MYAIEVSLQLKSIDNKDNTYRNQTNDARDKLSPIFSPEQRYLLLIIPITSAILGRNLDLKSENV